jgi:NAD-dependent deacetylase
MRSSECPGLVVLTGAGISQESGLATFRAADGLWAHERIEDVATPEGFRRDPARVHAFYNARRAELATVAPNAAHRALAELERAWVARGGDFLLVSQNIDDLHERAGSRRLLHMHGALRQARCLRCRGVAAWPGDMGTDSVCPACGRPGGMRPNIVWFGEIPIGMGEIGAALEGCGLFVSIGTSGSVYPAAGFVAEVRGRARTVELNLEPSAGAVLFDEARHGPATQVVPAFVAELLAQPAGADPIM